MTRRSRRLIAAIAAVVVMGVGVGCWALATFVGSTPATSHRAVLVYQDIPPTPDVACDHVYAPGAITPDLAHSACGDGDVSIATGQGLGCRNGATMIFGNSDPYGTGFYGISGQVEHIFQGTTDPDFKAVLKTCIGNDPAPAVPGLRVTPAVETPPTPCQYGQVTVSNGPTGLGGGQPLGPPIASTGAPGPDNSKRGYSGVILQIVVTGTSTSACTLTGERVPPSRTD